MTSVCPSEQVSIAGQPGGVEAARSKIRVSWMSFLWRSLKSEL